MTGTSIATVALLAAAAVLGPTTAQTEPERQAGAPRSDIVAFPRDAYDEVPTARGLQSDGAVLEVFAAEASRTFTVVVTVPSGVSCFVDAGRSFEAAPPVLNATPSCIAPEAR